MTYIRRFNENVNIMGIEKFAPSEISLYTSNGNFDYFFRDCSVDNSTLRINYYKKKNDPKKSTHLDIDEPQLFIIQFYFHEEVDKGIRVNVSMIYGGSVKFEFSLEKPNLLKVFNFNGFGSKFDAETKFALSDESIVELCKLFNNMGYSLTEKHFEFLNKYPYSYQHYESFRMTPLFDDAKILVINNGEPNRRSYLPNVLTFLTTRGINHLVTSSVTEIDTILQSENIIGVISTGSDYRISSPRSEDEESLSNRVLSSVNKPIIGMCYGFQSMAHFYGSEVKDSGKFFNDNINLSEWKKDSKLFKNFNVDDYQFSVSFHDIISECPKGFDVIAKYDKYILGIENEKMMRWGLAFHPEDIEKTYPILDNFIQVCVDYQNQTRVFETRILRFGNFK